MDARLSKPAKVKRRRLQFGLRTLLLLVLLASAGMSWVAVKMRRAERQKGVVSAIEGSGGTVHYDYWLGANDGDQRSGSPVPASLRRLLGEDFFRTVVSVDFRGNAIGNDDLTQLSGLPGLRSLLISNTFVTDAGLRRLQDLTALYTLDLSSLNITDAGLTHLTGLTGLYSLDLGDTDVTEAGVKRLKETLPNCEVYWNPPTEEERRSGLKGNERRRARIQREALAAIAAVGGEVERADGKVPKAVTLVRLRGARVADGALSALDDLASDLRIVDLRDSRITDEGLRSLRFMPQLQAIYLQNTQITDAGLEHLEELPQLKTINLENTRVTDRGVKKLQQRFKTCKVTWKPPTPD